MEVSKFLHEPCPCDNCELKAECKEHEWACRAFAYFVNNGDYESYTARMPTREMFHKIFVEEDKALRSYLQSLKIKDEMQSLLFE